MTVAAPTSYRRRAAYGATAGIAATIAGAGVGHLVAGAVDPASSPVLAVGSAVIDRTPTPVKEWAVATLGTADKPVLLASVVLVTLGLAAAAGVLALRRREAGLALIALLAGVATLAAVLRAGATLVAVLPGLVTAVVGVGALVRLLRFVAPVAAPVEPESTGRASMLSGSSTPTTRGVQRRQVLLGAGGFAAFGAVAGAVGQRLGAAATRAVAVLPTPRRPLPPLPTGLEATVADVTPLRTPQSSFYRVDTALVIPRVDPGDWRLDVDGDVERPFSLTYDELSALPLVERDITLTCVSNEIGGEYAGGARWIGVPVAQLLERAGVRPGADQILSTSTDGYTCSTPVAALTDDREALVAIGMNGEPLNRTHGFPARLVTPGLYGYVGATKWLTKLTATTFAEHQAYWTQRGWAEQAPIKTMTRIDTPHPLVKVAAGRLAVAGVAWAQRRGIDRVEVRVDEGPWQPATLGPDVGIDYWRQWYLPWDATPGRHTLTARAVDGTGTGTVQASAEAPPFPDGASGLHSIVTVVE